MWCKKKNLLQSLIICKRMENINVDKTDNTPPTPTLTTTDSARTNRSKFLKMGAAASGMAQPASATPAPLRSSAFVPPHTSSLSSSTSSSSSSRSFLGGSSDYDVVIAFLASNNAGGGYGDRPPNASSSLLLLSDWTASETMFYYRSPVDPVISTSTPYLSGAIRIADIENMCIDRYPCQTLLHLHMRSGRTYTFIMMGGETTAVSIVARLSTTCI